MHYGHCENDGFELLTMTAVCFVLFFLFIFDFTSSRAFVHLVTSFSCQGPLKSKPKKTARFKETFQYTHVKLYLLLTFCVTFH